MHLLFAHFLALFDFRRGRYRSPAPWWYYFSQLFFEIALVSSLLVVILYWALLAKGSLFTPENVHAHIMNS